ncbi:MAG: hypothetical protein GTO45_29890 [Candidatus Aminicenantes bacterium]|nr:hypothetical protein [Candidatus Aminicenantes bacterium]NIM77975.1 hypothetical protein [Candidatus Aminicenantes bacterium]NIN18830.1 hypothetical protein [Candidatus Aminicenantes bacterium]NIN46151.1 hypothetical protein [Candidatus Aminicenantes bacterium]NIN88987.1 hypothetical protein [Candidatus Aminicenantes bacterium]
MKRKNKTNLHTISVYMCVCALMFFMASCAGGGSNRVEVRIEVQDPYAVDYDKYDKIIYKDLALESDIKNYNPDKEIKYFFLTDLPKVVEKDVEHWDSEKHGDLSSRTDTLVISGTLKIEIKERSKIQEVTDTSDEGSGKKKRAFVTIQHWNMKLTVTLKDAADGTEIFNEEFNEKLADADPKSAKFNFEKVFYKITNRLSRKLTKSKRMQRRYILL